MAGLILASFTGFLSTAAFGQGTAPVNPKFIEWQKRRADEVARKSQESETGGNAQKRAAPKQAAAPADEDLGMGLLPTLVDMDYLADLNSGVVRAPVGGFPSSYDLRQQGRLTAIRDQNPYGTCWAHATMASLESWILGNEGVETDFSENNLANLHGWDWGFDDGGNATIATAYLARWGGPVDESSDPYPDWGGSTVKSPVRHIQRVFWIPGKSAPLDNDAIKQAIMERGAVYVSYYHTSSYYKSSTASYYYPGSGNGNHAVAIVGWNDNYSASNFSTKPAGNGAYLVRNSWGTGWGNSGYFWVSYYDGVFARSTMYSFANAEPTDNYGKIYQYDPLGDVSHFSTPYCANMFTATGTDKIAAVGFYALAPKTAYSLSIYTGCQSGKPTSGTCAISQSGTIDEAGFVTLPLSKSVAVASGSRFSVVLNLSTPGYGYPSAFEYAYTGITSGANASAGQSFYSFNGTSWTDLTSWNGTANFCIKAYTESASVVVSLASVAVSGPASVESGKAGKYVCTAKYSDNSEKTISATWSVVSGSEHAAISGDGTLTAGKTSLDRTVVIRASYAEGGVTKSDDWQLTVTAGPPAIPTELSATSGTETRAVRLTWAAVTGAESYSVYRSATSFPGNALYLGISESGKYSDSDAVPGVDYWYFVKAKNSSGASDFSAGASGWRALAAPGNVSAGDGASVDFVKVTWDAVEGASCYRVFRAESFDGDSTPLTGWISATEFTDSTAEPGTVYWYSVEAAVDSTGNRPSAAGIPDDGFRAVPVVPSAIAIEGDGAIPSGGSATYTAFALYSDGSRDESPLSPAWEVSAGTVSRTGGVTAPTVSANADIVISAQTTLEGVAISGTKTVAVTATAPGTPSNFRLVSATAAGVSLAWDAVPGASRYVVSRGASGGVMYLTMTETTFTDTSATPGVAYSYRVAAENAAGTGPQSAPVTVTIPLAAPAGVKATSDRTDGVRVTWGAVPGATHYRVARAASATGAKTDLGAWTADTAYLDTPPATDTAYFYFVKAATDSFGSNPGAWSAGVEGRRKAARTLLSLTVSGPDRVAAGGEAVYSCKASWSDGAEEAVSPTWSVSPASAGSIDANGRFAAASVSYDVGATVTATYGGKTGTASVTVLAPAAATAEITSVAAAQRWPFAGLVDIDYTLATTPAGTRAAVSVSAFDEDHGAAVAATTLSGDGAEGPVAAGTHRLTWNLGADHPGLHASALRVNVSAVPANPVTVTFDGNGGTVSQSSATYIAGDAYGTLPTAERTGYAFDGWFTAATDGDAVLAETPADENIVTLYAHWTPHTYTIHFDPNGGTGEMADIEMTYDETVNLTANAFANSGWSFIGWATSSDGAVTYANCAQVANLSDLDGTTITLFAVWVLGAPENVSASTNANAGVNITWSEISDADWYEIWRSTGSSPEGADCLGTIEGTNVYLDTTASVGVAYNYWIRSASNVGISRFSTTATGFRVEEPIWTIDSSGKLTKAVFDSIADLTIPTSVRMIASNVFNHKDCLTKVSIPFSVTNVAPTAFNYCDNLDDFVVEASNSSLTSYDGLLMSQDCSQLIAVPSGRSTVKLPSCVVDIAEGAFSGCRKLQSAILPDGIQSIPSRAFSGCTSLTTINIPQSVNSIGQYAFYNCSSLRSFAMPNSVVNVGSGSFWGCISLNTINLSSQLESISSHMFYGCTNLASISIPSGIKQFEDYAFEHCSKLKAISIPKTQQTIPDYVFAYCSDLEIVEIPDGVTSIGAGAFQRCGLSVVEIPGSVTNIEYSAFLGTSITSIAIPNGVHEIQSQTFADCDRLEQVYIPDNVTTISPYAFHSCGKLSKFQVDKNNSSYVSSNGLLLSKDGQHVICGVNGIVSIPQGVTSIAESAFAGRFGLTSVTIPDSVKYIEDHAFDDCRSLISVSIGSGVEYIRPESFSRCGKLNTVSISPDNSKYLSVNGLILSKDGTFLVHGANGNVTIPDTVTHIAMNAFRGCYGLTNVNIPSSVSYIGPGAFWLCTNLLSVVVPEGVCKIQSSSFQSCSQLIQVQLPTSVTNIGYSAFSGCRSLTSIRLPNGLKELGDYSFEQCDMLGEVVIPNSVECIGQYAFSQCSKLELVSLPSRLEAIGDRAFFHCHSLLSVEIPSGVTTIGAYAFYNCRNLMSVKILGDLDNYEISGLYDNTPSDLITYVTSRWGGPTDYWCGRRVFVQ